MKKFTVNKATGEQKWKYGKEIAIKLNVPAEHYTEIARFDSLEEARKCLAEHPAEIWDYRWGFQCIEMEYSWIEEIEVNDAGECIDFGDVWDVSEFPAEILLFGYTLKHMGDGIYELEHYYNEEEGIWE